MRDQATSDLIRTHPLSREAANLRKAIGDFYGIDIDGCNIVLAQGAIRAVDYPWAGPPGTVSGKKQIRIEIILVGDHIEADSDGVHAHICKYFCRQTTDRYKFLGSGGGGHLALRYSQQALQTPRDS